MKMKKRHFINLHKFLTPFIMWAFMVNANSFSTDGIIYLALHGTYAMIWLLKELIMPDKSFDEEISMPIFTAGFVTISLYWVAGYIAIIKSVSSSHVTILISISLFTLGMFLHMGADAQKYFVLKAKSGLITDGFFAHIRNPNYLGEILTYTGFNLICEHWFPHVFLLFMAVLIFLPGMRKKEASLSRHADWQQYSARTYYLIPFVW